MINIESILQLVIECGDIAIKRISSGDMQVRYKLDGTKVTNIDLEINEIIINKIGKDMVLSEELKSSHNKKVYNNDKFFILDPIDGTSSMIKNGKHFCIAICFYDKKNINNSYSIIHIPSDNTSYVSSAKGSYRVQDGISHDISILNNNENKVAVSMNSGEQKNVVSFIEKNSLFVSYSLVPIPSAIKFCKLANSECNFYIRSNGLKIWDFMPGFIIMHHIGYKSYNLDMSHFDCKIFDKNLKSGGFIIADPSFCFHN
jgi:3'(2'), 5'-bisphosphate nucleotidase